MFFKLGENHSNMRIAIREKVPGYTLVNTIFLVEDLIENMDIRFGVNNVFDKKYYLPSTGDSADYLRPGRTYYVSVGY